MIRTKEQPNCYLCGIEGRVVHTNMPDLLYRVPGSWNMRQCVNAACALLWLDPMPVTEDLGAGYQTYFTHGSGEPLPLRLLRLGYRLGTSIPDFILGLWHAESSLHSMYLGQATPGRLLDVGCGNGQFLNKMHTRGWEVCGVDFDPKAVENARQLYKLDVRAGSLADQHFPDSSFDAVTANHVIEHLPDPVAFLGEARRIVKPGGCLIVTTPNNQGLGHQMFQAHWYGIDPPRHVLVHSPMSLAECARRAGCSPVTVQTTAGRAETFIAGSFKLRAEDSANGGAQFGDNSILLRTLKTFQLRYREQLLLRTSPNCGEEAVLIFQKPPA
jgi:SAM-dependent methyltransferase